MWFLLVFLVDWTLVDGIERELVEVRDVSSGWRSDILNVEVTAFGEDYNLMLQRVPFQRSLKFLTMEKDENGEHFIKHHPPRDFQSKLFSNGDTVLYVHSRGNNIQVEGILSQEVFLEKNELNRSHIAVKKRLPSELIFEDMIVPRNSVSSSGWAADVTYPTPPLIQPELMVVVDYKNFKAMNFDDTKLGVYLTIFWQAVNSRYALVKDPEIQLLLTSVLVTKSEYLQPYITISLDTDEKGAVILDMDKALTAMGLYYFRYKNNSMPYFDLAMLMTGENIAQKRKDGWKTSLKGIAPVAGSCSIDYFLKTYSNFGMAEDFMPMYTGVLNHAHEVGHLLGATHDGDAPMTFLTGHPGALECPWEDGYLMSFRFGTKNHLRWSDCTIDQFRWMIKKFKDGACLRDTPMESIVPTTSILPGQLISLDKQCESIFGKNYVHSDKGDKNERCQELWCAEPFRTLRSRGPALEGSPCGYTSHQVNIRIRKYVKKDNNPPVPDEIILELLKQSMKLQ